MSALGQKCCIRCHTQYTIRRHKAARCDIIVERLTANNWQRVGRLPPDADAAAAAAGDIAACSQRISAAGHFSDGPMYGVEISVIVLLYTLSLRNK